MKVVHFITRLILGGAQENTLLTVIDQQREYADEVVLITGPGLGPEGSLERQAQQANVDLRVVPSLRRNIHPLRDWISYRELLTQLRDIQPEIVHTHSSKAGILGRAVAGRLGIPCVHTVHGAAFHRNQPAPVRWTFAAAERWAARYTAKWISVCDAMTDQYVAARVAPRDRFITIYSGMAVEPFLEPERPPAEIREELGLKPEHIVVGKVARLFHLKGHEDVIEAARRVASEIPELRFLFVGDGLLRKRLLERIRNAGLEDRFVFTGLVPPRRVAELVHAMDIVVHASLREGLARVLPQALIAGKPVISYDVDGAREVAIPGQTGFLLQPGDTGGMAEALRTLAGDAELRARLGTTGRERFTDQFRHQTMTRKIREVYHDVLAQGHGR